MSVLIPGAREIVDIGGIVIPVSNLHVIGGYTATSGRNTTLRIPTSSSGYQVPASMKFKVMAIQASFPFSATSLGVDIQLGYADNDIGEDTTTALTNPVYTFGSQNTQLFNAGGNSISGPNNIYTRVIGGTFEVPATKYTFIGSTITQAKIVYIFGKVVSA